MGFPKVVPVSHIFWSSMKQCLIGWMRERQWTEYISTLRKHLIRYHIGELLAKVRACGVAGQVANWIANWLSGKK